MPFESCDRRQIKSTESPDFFHRRRAPAEIGRRPRENMARMHYRTSDSLASQSEVARRNRQIHLPKASPMSAPQGRYSLSRIRCLTRCVNLRMLAIGTHHYPPPLVVGRVVGQVFVILPCVCGCIVVSLRRTARLDCFRWSGGIGVWDILLPRVGATRCTSSSGTFKCPDRAPRAGPSVSRRPAEHVTAW